MTPEYDRHPPSDGVFSRGTELGVRLLEPDVTGQIRFPSGFIYSKSKLFPFVVLLHDVRLPNQNENAAAKEINSELQAWARARGLKVPSVRR